MFVVIAYRWGWTNNHWYIVKITDNRQQAVRDAADECVSRGGKYGIAVSNNDGEIVAYFPSSYNEKTPYHNARLTMFEMIGNRIVSEYEQDNELPDWIVEIIQKKAGVAGAELAHRGQ